MRRTQYSGFGEIFNCLIVYLHVGGNDGTYQGYGSGSWKRSIFVEAEAEAGSGKWVPLPLTLFDNTRTKCFFNTKQTIETYHYKSL